MRSIRVASTIARTANAARHFSCRLPRPARFRGSRALGDILMPLCVYPRLPFPSGERALYIIATPPFALCLSFLRLSRYASFGRRLPTTGYFNWIFVETFSPSPCLVLRLPRMLPPLSRFPEYASMRPYRFLCAARCLKRFHRENRDRHDA